jgi:hypothetical protein
MESTPEFIAKGYSRIFVESEEAATFVRDFFEKDDEFEYGYMHTKMILVCDIDNTNLDWKLEYNGKFEGNLEGMLLAAKRADIRVVVAIAYDSDNLGLEYFKSLESSDPRKDAVLDLLIRKLEDNGVTVSEDREVIRDSGIYESLIELFAKYK